MRLPKCRHCNYTVPICEIKEAREREPHADLWDLQTEILRAHFMERHPKDYEQLQRRLKDRYGD